MSGDFINVNKPVRRKLRSVLLHNICRECEAYFGSRNADRHFYVIRCPQDAMGLFAVINYVVWHLKRAQELKLEPVIDWQHYPNKYFTEDGTAGKINVWECFFEPVSGISLDEVYRSKNVRMSGGDWQADAMKEVTDKEALADSHSTYVKYIKLNPLMQKKLDEELARIGVNAGKVLGVKIRGTDFISSAPTDHAHVPGIDDNLRIVSEKVKEWGPFDRIYLSTEDGDALRSMEQVYGERLYYTGKNTFKADEVGAKWLGDVYESGVSDKISDMEDYLLATYILAHTDYLIAPCVGGTVGALRIRGGFKEMLITG